MEGNAIRVYVDPSGEDFESLLKIIPEVPVAEAKGLLVIKVKDAPASLE